MNLSLDNKKVLLSRVNLFRTFNDKFVVTFLISLAEQIAVVRNVPFYQEIPEMVIRNLSKSQINLIK